MSGQGKRNPTVGERWESGMPHDPRSVAIFKGIARVDAEQCSNSFDWHSGGDGDNGETLMFELDVHFADVDAQTEADASHAAGYAEAVADVVAWLASDKDVPRMSHIAIAYRISGGAHVGAAKKGGET